MTLIKFPMDPERRDINEIIECAIIHGKRTLEYKEGYLICYSSSLEVQKKDWSSCVYVTESCYGKADFKKYGVLERGNVYLTDDLGNVSGSAGVVTIFKRDNDITKAILNKIRELEGKKDL
ncbi:MAG: hypothetical protein ACE5K4_08410 [Candidatus Hydrothermarchaeota archaeon]